MDHKTPSKTKNSQDLSKTRYTIKKKKVIRKKNQHLSSSNNLFYKSKNS